MKNLSVREKSSSIVSKTDVDPVEVARGQNTWDAGGGG
jgi:hypothetical protein